MIACTDTLGSIDDKAITEVEKRTGLIFPAAYKAFLLQSNGGNPGELFFTVPNWGETLLNYFLGIKKDAEYDIEVNLERMEGRIPQGLLPIADDPGGNLLCIGCSRGIEGYVYFWDHEDEPCETPEKLEDWSNIHLLARDWNTFVKNLSREPKS